MNFLISFPLGFVVLRIWLAANPAERRSISISQIVLAYITALTLLHGIANRQYWYVLTSLLFFLLIFGSEIWIFRKTWADKWRNRRK